MAQLYKDLFDFLCGSIVQVGIDDQIIRRDRFRERDGADLVDVVRIFQIAHPRGGVVVRGVRVGGTGGSFSIEHGQDRGVMNAGGRSLFEIQGGGYPVVGEELKTAELV